MCENMQKCWYAQILLKHAARKGTADYSSSTWVTHGISWPFTNPDKTQNAMVSPTGPGF